MIPSLFATGTWEDALLRFGVRDGSSLMGTDSVGITPQGGSNRSRDSCRLQPPSVYMAGGPRP